MYNTEYITECGTGKKNILSAAGPQQQNFIKFFDRIFENYNNYAGRHFYVNIFYHHIHIGPRMNSNSQTMKIRSNCEINIIKLIFYHLVKHTRCTLTNANGKQAMRQ